MITVLFFAQLRDQLGCESVSVPAQDIGTFATLATLRAHLVAQNPGWQSHLEADSVLFAVNHTLVKAEHPVRAGDEVAFMPPVTGG